MISLILKCYLTILISVGMGSLFLFMTGLYFIFTRVGKSPKQAKLKAVELAKTYKTEQLVEDSKIRKLDRFNANQDLSSIAGDDIISTKIDLARAFIETGNKNSAKSILRGISKQGSADQQQEAQRLLQLT